MTNGKKKIRKANSKPVALTIAGSDSSGGAGIQLDIKAFLALDVFGTSAITCLTAQNPDEVKGISAAAPAMVALQIKTVCEAFHVSAAKTGMLYSATIIKAAARAVTLSKIPVLVVDPVMIATSGALLLRQDAVKVLCSRLLAIATVITPNIQEAEILCGHRIRSVKELKSAAKEIAERYGTACVVKGGHLPGGRVVDVLFHEGAGHCFTSSRLRVAGTHGTGCAFSAALTAYLARGESLPAAVGLAKHFVRNALKHAQKVGRLHFNV